MTVVMFSSGAGSWAAAKRAAQVHGTDGLVLLFADTKIEDADNYRFLEQAAQNVGGELVRIEDGRDVWQVFFDNRFLGNTRVDLCSRILKRELMRSWVDEHCPPGTPVVFGIDWTEIHRTKRIKAGWEPYKAQFPMCDPPLMDKAQILEQLRVEGIEPPRLYAKGFPHANCGGFCVKAGQAQFELLLRADRDLYLHHEQREQDLREHLGKDVAIMRDRFVRNGADVVKPLTMRAFRERLEAQPGLFDRDEWGACACGA